MSGYRFTVYVVTGRDYTSEGSEEIAYRGSSDGEALTVAKLAAQKGDTRVRIIVEVA